MPCNERVHLLTFHSRRASLLQLYKFSVAILYIQYELCIYSLSSEQSESEMSYDLKDALDLPSYLILRTIRLCGTWSVEKEIPMEVSEYGVHWLFSATVSAR